MWKGRLRRSGAITLSLVPLHAKDAVAGTTAAFAFGSGRRECASLGSAKAVVAPKGPRGDGFTVDKTYSDSEVSEDLEEGLFGAFVFLLD